ncbi:S1 family serine peptidase [Streptomyces sp. NPDC001515]
MAGAVPAQAIVGGEPATVNSAPYMASVRAQTWTGSLSHICGGILLTGNKVMTAAHCVDGQDAGKMNVAWGGLNRSRLPKNSAVSKISIISEYNPTNLIGDVAVLTLSTTAVEGAGVQFARLATSDPAPGASITVTGWGRTRQLSAALPDELQAVSLPVTTGDACKAAYSEPGDPFTLTGRFCAGPADGSQAICEGDAGGPAVLDGVVVGIVSGGRGCGLPDSPSVFSSTAYWGSWLQGQ